MRGYSPNTTIMPATVASSVPPAIWKAISVGLGDDDASAHTAAAFSTIVPPLGHAVSIQNAPSTSITIIARRPDTLAATRFVLGT